MKIHFFSFKPYEANGLNAFLGNHSAYFDPLRLDLTTAASASGAEAISVFTSDVVSAEVLEVLADCGAKYLAVRATGTDHVDLTHARQLNIKVANVPDYSPQAIAEHALMLMLSAYRKSRETQTRVARFDFRIESLIGEEIYEKTVGLIGLGSIGKHAAKLLKAFGAKVLVYDPEPDLEFIKAHGLEYTGLTSLYAQSDIISLHCPLTKNTRYLIDRETIVQMKKGVVIINTARGGLINTSVLREFLDNGKISALGLDVYEYEKGLFFHDHSMDPAKDLVLSELMKYPQVIVTPHQAFLTSRALKNIARITFANINAWASGQKAPHEL